MIPNLRCVVEYATFRRADDLFEGFAFERSAFDQVVEVSDIRLVVFTVVIFGVSAEMCGAGRLLHMVMQVIQTTLLLSL